MVQNGKRILCIALVSLVLITWSTSAAFAGAKNVIVLVPDGCSQSIQTLARWVKGSDLNIDALHTGMMKTYMANSVITGSAAAATAFATGHKTTARFLGVGPRTDDLLSTFTPTADPYVPVASVLEGAKMYGKSTGLIATSRITHATPAGYACHIEDRGMDNEIMEHMVYNNVDVVFGGGARHLIPSGETYTTTFGDTWNGKRTDGENLMNALTEKGYAFVDNKTDMMALTAAPAWGLFDDSHMDADIDRDDLHPTQPSLAEMTEKAIELLSQDPDGFFLMVEGSQVDWAGHANDAAWMVTDFLAFDAAVGKAMEFAQSNTDTLVLIFPDHNTGALSLGNSTTDSGYTSISVEDLIDPIKEATVTSNVLFDMISEEPTVTEIRDLFAQYWGSYWNDMTDEEIEGIIEVYIEHKDDSYGPQYPLAEYISANLTVFGFPTHGHSGESVPIWSYGPEKPMGLYDNTEMATIVADAFGFDLSTVTQKLYQDAAWAGNATIDLTDSENPVLLISGYQLPASKDYMLDPDGNKIQLEGINVYAPQINKFFVHRSALGQIWLNNI